MSDIDDDKNTLNLLQIGLFYFLFIIPHKAKNEKNMNVCGYPTVPAKMYRP